MAPTKRPRPDFSPPRPGKSKSSEKRVQVSEAALQGGSRSKNSKNAATAKSRAASNGNKSIQKSTTPTSKPSVQEIYKEKGLTKKSSRHGTSSKDVGSAIKKAKTAGDLGRKGTRAAILGSDEDEDDDDSEEMDETPRSRGRPKKASKTGRVFLDDDASHDEEDDDEADEDVDMDDDNDTPAHTNRRQPISLSDAEQDSDRTVDRSSSPTNAPEPDMVLAEITTQENPAPIPQPLIQKILQHHFSDPTKTKISGDAKELVSKYIEVFVREAIIRSDFARQEREKDSGGGGSGFLEVEDLERAAVQLLLDF